MWGRDQHLREEEGSSSEKKEKSQVRTLTSVVLGSCDSPPSVHEVQDIGTRDTDHSYSSTYL